MILCGDEFMTVIYEVGNNLYVNITNKCPCACTFCIRKNGDGAYGSDSLWLEREPSVDEVKKLIDKAGIEKYNEIVFCGFGEPLERLDDVVELCRYIKSKLPDLPVRINTNGLSDLIHGKPTAYMLENVVDIVSISLNAGTEEEYLKVTNPKFGKGSFSALQKFALDCKKYVNKVIFTVVDVISKEEIKKAQEIADKSGIPLRVRRYDG